MKNWNLIGFTLIELMVTITIIVILSGISVAGYYRFSQREAALDDARNFVTEMKKVQALAKNLVYPNDCTGLVNYNLVSDCFGKEDCQTMTAYAVCNSQVLPIKVIDKEKVLSKAYFTYDINVDFQAGTGGISPFGTYLMTNTKDPYQVSVVTDSNGNIVVSEK
jgi:prepilin-type N-terminal cleavage/methylation domain-containing protein